MTNVKREFLPLRDRYYFDFKECTYKNGWAQLDSKQDASYYGNWVNPFTLELVCYCEGDVTRTQCRNEPEFVQTLIESIQWHNERGYGPALIDALADDSLKERFTQLGLDCYLH